MDFTSLALIKSAKKAVIEALDDRDKQIAVSLPVRQIEKLKKIVLEDNRESNEVVFLACSVMTYSQLVQFFLSCEKISIDSLSKFFKSLDSSESSSAITLKKRIQYLLHTVYFADVFTDSKL